ncbi:leucyl/phenylalanyl-tRNA--protein transferase [Marinicella sediminis]|uniref:Leucyl/phenylalanyl-tRNA--protein transferase n=1 Tax=Marinicella sediminis TaxID=1792834 RepID=A0ABV7J9R8_9GAMM|nr:leucyl/phenylalanyl-tRNA--protein transferase [Marinicella sediminis]
MILPCVDGCTEFPDAKQALQDPDGLLCFGGDLSVERLKNAYAHGIFPWYSVGEPILWWSPSERMVLPPAELRINRSFKKTLNRLQPVYHLNRHFDRVIECCARIPRKDQGTWIHPEMIKAYQDMFAAGHAFCLEVEVDGQLAGGIYGVKTPRVWCGESMFSLQSDGSKLAMHGLCQHLLAAGIELLDCQLHNPHLESMGARLISRTEFMTFLK